MKALLRLGLFALAQLLAAEDFTVTFLHVNDTHDRIEPTMIRGKAYGGMTRLGTLIEKYRKADSNVVFLHAGDAFQGTFYFNVYEGLADLAFLNEMHVDAMAVGNHEFDHGPRALADFATNAQFPVLSANLDLDSEPALKNLIHRSTIMVRGGQRIGIVGATIPRMPDLSNPGPTVHMRDLASSIQAEVDAMTKEGVNKIVLLSHVGYEDEETLAATLHGVDVVVGGHTHTLLGTSTAPGFIAARGPYPTVIANADGGKTLVVQAWEGEKVLGRLQVTFDEEGRVKQWSDTQPIIVDDSIPEEPELKALVAAFQKPLLAQRDRKIAVAEELIPQYGAMSEIIPDVMLAATAKQNSTIALMNPSGVRAPIEKGDITYGMALLVQPFSNTLVVMDLTGTQIKETLEDIVRGTFTSGIRVSSGVRYILDLSKPAGSRIVDLTFNGRPLDPTATYRVVVNNFMANGGDSLFTLKNSTGYRYDTGLIDVDMFVEYLITHSPLRPKFEGRVGDARSKNGPAANPDR